MKEIKQIMYLKFNEPNSLNFNNFQIQMHSSSINLKLLLKNPKSFIVSITFSLVLGCKVPFL